MTAARVLQEAGHERPLSVGIEYELADGVGQALVATGAAELATLVPPEIKPTAPLETKRARVARRGDE